MNGDAVALLATAEAVDRAILGPLGIPVAFLVGMVSFFSPCILPLVPGYLSFVSGLSGEALDSPSARKRILGGTLLFVLGFSLVFTALGAAATGLGFYVLANQAVFERIAGSIVIVMGLSFLVPGMFRVLERERRPFLSRVKPGVAGAFPLGLAFAIGWIPCVGPGLGTILTLSTGERSIGRGAVMLFAFSLGFGVWFILGGLAFRRATSAVAALRRHQQGLRVAGGVFLLTIGVLLVSGLWGAIMAPIRRAARDFATLI